MKKVFGTLLAGILIVSLGHSPISAQDAPGWAIGGGFGFPVASSGFFSGSDGNGSVSSFGLVVQSPYSVTFGPLNLNIGGYIGMSPYSGGDPSGTGEGTWIEFWPSVNLAVNDLAELPVPVGIHAGAGMMGSGFGVAGGVSAVLVQAPVVVSAGVNMAYALSSDLDDYKPYLLRVYVAASYPLPK